MDSHSPCSHQYHFLCVARLLIVLLCMAGGLLTAGCARFPEGEDTTDAPPRTLYAEMTVRGEINPAYNYYFVLGLDQADRSGPVPDAEGNTTGTGFALIEPADTPQEEKPPFYVMYGLEAGGTFAQFLLNDETGRYDPVGLPYRFGIREVGGRFAVLWVEIDQRAFAPYTGEVANPKAQLNMISMNTTNPAPGVFKQYDGIGVTGKEYVTPITLTTQSSLASGVGAPPEPAYTDGELTPSSIADLDLVDWRIEVRVGKR